MLRSLVFLCASILISGCVPASPGGSTPASASADFLLPAERARLHLPVEGEITLAAPKDWKAVKDLPPEAKEAVHAFLEKQSVEWLITAARPMGDHWLLWITFPKIADGGIDLIYSAEKKKIVGEFLGGWRG